MSPIEEMKLIDPLCGMSEGAGGKRYYRSYQDRTAVPWLGLGKVCQSYNIIYILH